MCEDVCADPMKLHGRAAIEDCVFYRMLWQFAKGHERYVKYFPSRDSHTRGANATSVRHAKRLVVTAITLI
jgi:hypothetical protein